MKAPDPFGLLDALLEPLEGTRQLAAIRRGLWIHQTAPRPPVGLTPHAIIHRQNKLVVRYYAPKTPAFRTPVVVVPSLINRAYICDLEPDRSLVGGLAALGHPTYLIDWGEPGPEDSGQGVTPTLLMLRRSMDRIARHAQAPRVHLFGYCQGGTLAVMAAARWPAPVASLSVLNAPVLFAEGGRFRRFVEGCDPATLEDPDGLVPVALMGVAFKLLDPMGNWTKYAGIDAAAKDPTSLRRALARERWLEENVPAPGAFVREFIRLGYQEDRLIAGTWEVDGQPVRLGDIRAPLHCVVCQRDAISPAAACKPLYDAVGSADKTLSDLEAGHIGVVVGGMGPKVFYPLLHRWFEAREGA